MMKLPSFYEGVYVNIGPQRRRRRKNKLKMYYLACFIAPRDSSRQGTFEIIPETAVVLIEIWFFSGTSNPKESHNNLF